MTPKLTNTDGLCYGSVYCKKKKKKKRKRAFLIHPKQNAQSKLQNSKDTSTKIFCNAAHDAEDVKPVSALMFSIAPEYYHMQNPEEVYKETV